MALPRNLSLDKFRSALQPCARLVMLNTANMPFQTLFGCNCSGRKKAALTYVATYTFGCFTKHWNNFQILLLGRVFCGVATSLLYSAFESWLVAEHFKVMMHATSEALILQALCCALSAELAAGLLAADSPPARARACPSSHCWPSLLRFALPC